MEPLESGALVHGDDAVEMAVRADASAGAHLKTEPASNIDAVLCPICRRRLFSHGATGIRLRTRILVFEDGHAYAKCRYCRSDVIVPLAMHEALPEEWLTVWNEQEDGRTR